MIFQQEFQAVVLAAGKGSRIQEITVDKPKCLLPVGSKPLLWYPLHKLQLTGFTDVIVLVLENQIKEIQSALDKHDLEIKIDYVTIPAEDELGTADSLRMIHDKIKCDLVVLSCDLVSDVKLKGALDLFRKHNATITALFLRPTASEQTKVPGPKVKYKPEKDLVGLDAQTSRLVFLASASDFDGEVTLPKTLVKKHTNITMHSGLIDSHVYVMKKWVLKYLAQETGLSTIKGELLPHIVKKQLLKPPKVVANDENCSDSSQNKDIFAYANETELQCLTRKMSSYNDHIGDMNPSYHGDSIRCYAYVADKDSYGVRVNTLPAYWSINNMILEKWDKITNSKQATLISAKAEIKSQQVDNKCIIWDGCKLNEKTSFKNSIIASNTEVKSFSRVFNCIVMNNVTVKERVALENCIVCDGAVIESGCNITNCLIGSRHLVAENSNHSHEVLTETDRLMEF